MRAFITSISPLLAGLLFGFGLMLSGMTDPQRVLGFLDLFGHWDPALAFVMGGAVAVTVVTFAIARRRGSTLTGINLELPERGAITPPLLFGSALFGVGWGLSGACPGPALILAAGGGWHAPLFVAAMVGGMVLSDRLSRPKAAEDAVTAEPSEAGASCG